MADGWLGNESTDHVCLIEMCVPFQALQKYQISNLFELSLAACTALLLSRISFR